MSVNLTAGVCPFVCLSFRLSSEGNLSLGRGVTDPRLETETLLTLFLQVLPDWGPASMVERDMG